MKEFEDGLIFGENMGSSKWEFFGRTQYSEVKISMLYSTGIATLSKLSFFLISGATS